MKQDVKTNKNHNRGERLASVILTAVASARFTTHWRPLPPITRNLTENDDEEDSSHPIPGFSLLTTSLYKQNVIKVTLSDQWEKDVSIIVNLYCSYRKGPVLRLYFILEKIEQNSNEDKKKPCVLLISLVNRAHLQTDKKKLNSLIESLPNDMDSNKQKHMWYH